MNQKHWLNDDTDGIVSTFTGELIASDNTTEIYRTKDTCNYIIHSCINQEKDLWQVHVYTSKAQLETAINSHCYPDGYLSDAILKKLWINQKRCKMYKHIVPVKTETY